MKIYLVGWVEFKNKKNARKYSRSLTRYERCWTAIRCKVTGELRCIDDDYPDWAL
jgi:hypothetical protein